MSFAFTPVVHTLPDLAKTIGGKLQIIRVGKASDKLRWVARINGSSGCHVGVRPGNTTMESVYAPSYISDSPESARRGLARWLSRNTLIVRDLKSRAEHRLPLGLIRP